MTRTVFPWPGGKSTYAGGIVEALPEHGCFVEAFGGSGAVTFNKPPSTIEVYNDLDGDIPQFFRVLRDQGEELQSYLQKVEFSRELYENWTRRYYEGWRASDEVKRAAIFFFNRYAQWGGKYEGVSGFARSASGRDKAKTWRNKVDKLEEFQERLRAEAPGEWPEEFEEFRDRHRGVLVDNLDYRELFEKYDKDNAEGDGTVFYCDPPYVDTEHRYSGAGFDHEELMDALEELDADWIVSYGTDYPPRLEEMAEQVHQPQTTTRGIDRANTDGKTAHERLFLSYPKKGRWVSGGIDEHNSALTEDW